MFTLATQEPPSGYDKSSIIVKTNKHFLKLAHSTAFEHWMPNGQKTSYGVFKWYFYDLIMQLINTASVLTTVAKELSFSLLYKSCKLIKKSWFYSKI